MSRTGAGHDAKRQAALAASASVRSGMVVGLGTGSTAAFLIRELGRRVREERLSIVGVPTSHAAAALGREQGLRLCSLDQVERIDLAFDGADEIDPVLNLIKGGGAAHTIEKLVDGSADRFVVIADETKLVDRLGSRCAVPIEVLPLAWPWVARALSRLGATAALRTGSGKEGPVISDLGNLIADARFMRIDDAADLARRLDSIGGIVEHGIFAGMAHEAWIGSCADGGVRRLAAGSVAAAERPR